MRNTIFPIYVVIDFSGSMTDPIDAMSNRHRIDVAKEIIPTLMDSMKKDASIAESLRVRVIGFNRDVILCTDLLDYYGLDKWYNAQKDNFLTICNDQTWYGKAFNTVHACINADVDGFTRQNMGYYRPLVYFLTDGIPNDANASDRGNSYRALVSNTDSHRNPVIFCIGIGDANMSTLKQYGASRLGSKNGAYITANPRMTFVIKKGVKTSDGLKNLNENVVETIKYSLQQRTTAYPTMKKEIVLDPFDGEKMGSANRRLQEFFDQDNFNIG